MKRLKNMVLPKSNRIILCALLLFLLSMGCVYYIINKSYLDLSHTTHTGSLALDPNAGFFTAAGAPGTGTGSSQTIQIPGYEFLSADANGLLQVLLTNPYSNPCYFRFSIALAGGELLYQSQLVPPGQAVPNPSLNQALLPGSYQVVLRIESFALGTQAPMNGAKLSVPLHIIS